MHAGWPRREFLDEVVRTAQAFPDLAGSSVGALGRRFELAFVSQAVTQPAAKALAAIKDAAAASTFRALKPTPRPAERRGSRQIPDYLADLFPRALCVRTRKDSSRPSGRARRPMEPIGWPSLAQLTTLLCHGFSAPVRPSLATSSDRSASVVVRA